MDSKLKDFQIPDDDSNVTFLVEGKRLYVHREILGMFSPVFKAMFKQDFKEKDSNAIELPTKNFNEFVDLLRSIYPPVIKITALAEEYMLNDIKERCFQMLIGQPESLDLIVVAQMYDREDLLKKCTKVIGKRLSHYQITRSSQYLTTFNDKSKAAIFEQRVIHYEGQYGAHLN